MPLFLKWAVWANFQQRGPGSSELGHCFFMDSRLSSWVSEAPSLALEPSPRLQRHHGLTVGPALLMSYSVSELCGKCLEASNLVGILGCVNMY